MLGGQASIHWSFFTIFIVTFVKSISAGSAFTGKPVIAGYYPNYADQDPSALPYSLYTHIDYFVAVSAPAPNYIDFVGVPESNIRAIISNAHAKKVTVSLVLGGWTGSVYFSNLVATDSSRQAYATKIKQVLVKYGFDGVDIDWEYPGREGNDGNIINSQDTNNFARFFKTLRATLGDSYRISVSISLVGFTKSDGNSLTDYSAFTPYVDYWNVMGYDVFGPWDGVTTSGPNSPLADTCVKAFGTPYSLATGVYLLVNGGVPRSHIVTGLPAYSHAYKTKSSSLTSTTVGRYTTKLFQPITGAATEDGYTFTQLVQNKYLSSSGSSGSSGYTRYYDDCTNSPFIFNSAKKTLISYDDSQSVLAKSQWAKGQGLAGVTFFDTTGDLAPSYPLLTAARKAFIISRTLTDKIDRFLTPKGSKRDQMTAFNYTVELDSLSKRADLSIQSVGISRNSTIRKPIRQVPYHAHSYVVADITSS